MSARARWPLGPLLILLAGAAGVAISLYGYWVPLTGITGSAGALLVVASSLALVIDALILWRSHGGAMFWLFWVLGLLGALGTLAAAGFLHAWVLLGANVVVLLGLLVTLAHRGQTKELIA